MRVQKKNIWRKAQMQQPQKGASRPCVWLVLHDSWMCAVSALCWSAHPRLQPRASIWQESQPQPRGTSPLNPTPTLHRLNSLQSKQCGCSKPIPDWLHSQQHGRELVCNNLLTRRGLFSAAGHRGDMSNPEMPQARMSMVSSQEMSQLAWQPWAGFVQAHCGTG